MSIHNFSIKKDVPSYFLPDTSIAILNLCYLSANAIHTFYSYLCILFLFLPFLEHDTHSKRGYSLVHTIYACCFSFSQLFRNGNFPFQYIKVNQCFQVFCQTGDLYFEHCRDCGQFSVSRRAAIAFITEK